MRLIDADELILHLNDYALQEAPFRGESADTYNAIENCIKAVEEQPTAYDVDKILEELQTEKGYACLGRQCTRREYYKVCFRGEKAQEVAIDKEIEIVQQGGVSDDVCEWRLCDEEANVYDTSCRNPHILIDGAPEENNYKYCPYCGKKIKVVDNDK